MQVKNFVIIDNNTSKFSLLNFYVWCTNETFLNVLDINVKITRLCTKVFYFLCQQSVSRVSKRMKILFRAKVFLHPSTSMNANPCPGQEKYNVIFHCISGTTFECTCWIFWMLNITSKGKFDGFWPFVPFILRKLFAFEWM